VTESTTVVTSMMSMVGDQAKLLPDPTVGLRGTCSSTGTVLPVLLSSSAVVNRVR
jgi:hypothetical protein